MNNNNHPFLIFLSKGIGQGAGLALAAVLVVFGIYWSVGKAAAADLNYSVDTTFVLTSPGTSVTVKAGSSATSLVVGASDLTVVIPSSSVFTVTSANTLHASGSGGSVYKSCLDTLDKVTITTASTSGTYTIYTSGVSYCPGTGGGGGSGSGSGTSGGGGTAPPSQPTASQPTPSTPTTQTTTPALKPLPYPQPKNSAELQANLATLLENLSALKNYQQSLLGAGTPAVSPTPGSIPPAGSYKVNLQLNSRGSEVIALQNFLKSLGPEIYPEGLVTGFYGNLTKMAVGRFQLKYGIVSGPNDPGYGVVGPKTRAKINSLLGL
jgi:hypothetical protein